MYYNILVSNVASILIQSILWQYFGQKKESSNRYLQGWVGLRLMKLNLEKGHYSRQIVRENDVLNQVC